MDAPPLIDGYNRVWQELSTAVHNRQHAFHTFTLATVDEQGFPQARTMVLRGIDREGKTIQFNGDARSPKVSELCENPTVCVLFYGAKEKLQIRACGTVTIHCNDVVSEEAWSKMQRMSRDCYRTPFAPSSEYTNSDTDTELLSVSEGYSNLVVCNLTLSSLEWVSLSSEGHQRVRHDFVSDSEVVTKHLHP